MGLSYLPSLYAFLHSFYFFSFSFPFSSSPSRLPPPFTSFPHYSPPFYPFSPHLPHFFYSLFTLPHTLPLPPSTLFLFYPGASIILAITCLYLSLSFSFFLLFTLILILILLDPSHFPYAVFLSLACIPLLAPPHFVPGVLFSYFRFFPVVPSLPAPLFAPCRLLPRSCVHHILTLPSGVAQSPSSIFCLLVLCFAFFNCFTFLLSRFALLLYPYPHPHPSAPSLTLAVCLFMLL